MTLVSIITPSYNQAAYLEFTLQSVLNQAGVQFESSGPETKNPVASYAATAVPGFKPDIISIEYIVIDGGSSDNSLAHIEKVANSLAYWVSEKDNGQAEAINKGFRRARGEIVAWLNSDDLFLPGAVQKAVAALVANPSLGMLFGDALTIDPDGRPLNWLHFGDWGLRDLMAFRMICQPAVFMRRSVLEQAGYLDESYHFMLDHHLWIRMARLAAIQHIPQVLAAARHHPQAKNVRQASAFSQETQRILAWMSSQPDLAEIYRLNERMILGGAARLQARYELDGGESSKALCDYLRALRYTPIYALKHWHRMLYALFSLLRAKKAFESADRFLHHSSMERKRQAIPWGKLLDQGSLSGWPGLQLDLEGKTLDANLH